MVPGTLWAIRRSCNNLEQLLYMSGRTENGANENNRTKLGARMKIMWEAQLVDPPIDYITLNCLVMTRSRHCLSVIIS